MFGKKKAKGKAVGGEKKAKRKSRGGGNGAAKMKAFLAENVEKMGLGAVALVALYLVYAGFSKDKLATGPEAVQQAIANAENRMTSPTWANVRDTRVPEPDTFDQRATLDTIPLDSDAYALSIPFHPRLKEPSKLRSDPQLLAPIDIEVRAGYGGLAIKSSGEGGSRLGAISGNVPGMRPIPPGLLQSRGRVTLGGTYESSYFVSIVGLVPYKLQFDLYGEAFVGASEYSTERDVPKYVGLLVERAEVQADGSLSAWTQLDSEAAMLTEPERWDGKGEEVVATDHMIRELVMDIPPIVLKDTSVFARHSSVPTQEMLQSQEAAERQRERAAATNNRGQRGFGARDDHAPAEERADVATEVEKAQPLIDVDNGMFRFFDFTVEPSKTYAYRVRALLDDPNNPIEDQPPTAAACETAVLIRRQNAENNYVGSPFSEPSKPIYISEGNSVLAGEAVTPRMRGKRVRMFSKSTDEPRLTLLTLVWDAANVFEVPIKVDVGRGAVLNGKAEGVEVVSPKLQKVKTLETYDFATDAMVLDIHGGESLGGDLRSPGYALIWQGGQLEFRSEFGDLPTFEASEIPPDQDRIQAEAEAARRANEEREREGGGRRRRGGRNNRDRGPERGQEGGVFDQ